MSKAQRGPPTKADPDGKIQVFVRASEGHNTTNHWVKPSLKISDLKKQVEARHGVRSSEQRLIYIGRRLTDGATVQESMLSSGCVVTLLIDAKYSLCPKGAELADAQNGAALDEEVSLYVTRLCHTNALTKLVQLIHEGGVPVDELVEVNGADGSPVSGRLAFQSASHMLTFMPRSPLRPDTVYTVTLKQAHMHLKKEIAELGNGRMQKLRNVISQPEFSFTFSTTDSPWRKIKVHRRYASESFPSTLPVVTWTIVLKNADEVIEGLKVLIADAMGVDEDEDITAVHTMTVDRQGFLNYSSVDHSNIAALEDGDRVMVSIKAAAPPPSKKQRVAEQSAADTSAGGRSSDQHPTNRSAKDRLAELKDLYDSGLISEEDFQKKKASILEGI